MGSTNASTVPKLRDELALCQEELAHVRRQQEDAALTRADIEDLTSRLVNVTTRLDKTLTRSESVVGLRGWVKRRLLKALPRPDEEDELALLRSSDLMDGAWYLQQYPKVVSSGLSPALHYLRRGAEENRNPGPVFNTRVYVQQHPGLPKAMNPLVHHLSSVPHPTT